MAMRGQDERVHMNPNVLANGPLTLRVCGAQGFLHRISSLALFAFFVAHTYEFDRKVNFTASKYAPTRSGPSGFCSSDGIALASRGSIASHRVSIAGGRILALQLEHPVHKLAQR